MDDLITLKHICREHECDPYKLRMALRKSNLRPKNRRWKWPPDDPQLPDVHAIAKTLPKEK